VAADVVEVLEVLRFKTNRRRKIVRREEGRSPGSEGGRGISLPRRCRRIPVAEVTELRREICAAWRRSSAREQRGNEEGGRGLL
jgi:hypothetical protein